MPHSRYTFPFFFPQATVLCFLAENSLSFTLAPKLISLSQTLAKDPPTLGKLAMDRTSASIKMRLGVAETFLGKTLENLKTSFFSVNMDEATSNNRSRVLDILV